MDPITIAYGFGFGAAGGAVRGILGYSVNRKVEDFEWSQFGIQVIGSAICGVAASSVGMPVDLYITSTSGVAIMEIVREAYKAIFSPKKKK